jgi:Protein of unknown function (DUF3551)
MRSSLFILGIFTATLCVAQPAAAQNYPWCVYENFAGGATNCGFSTFQQCLAARTGNSDSCGANPRHQPSRDQLPSHYHY